MATWFPITTTTLGSSAASVTFSNIPQTYTDLVLRWSARTTTSTGFSLSRIEINSNTGTNYSATFLSGDGSAASSGRSSAVTYNFPGISNSDATTASTFSSNELYIPNYAGSSQKPSSSFGVGEDNATAGLIRTYANLWNQTSAITSLSIYTTLTWAAGSTFTLYGISKVA